MGRPDSPLGAARRTAFELDTLVREFNHMDDLLGHRAGKLLRKDKPFVVVAHDEPYFFQVCSLIREQEMKIGRWTEEDETLFQERAELQESNNP